MFYGIQKGAIAALTLDSSWFDSINEVYAKRRQHIYDLVEKLGCTYDCNSVGLFVWAKLPAGVDAEKLGMDDELLQEEGQTWSQTFKTAGKYTYICSPHGGAGMNGEIEVAA